MCLFIWSKYFSSYHLITFLHCSRVLLTKAETSPTEGLSLQTALWLFIKSSSNMAAKLWHLPDRPSWLENIHFIKSLKRLLILGVIYWWPSADGVLFTANCCGTICTSKSVFLYLWHFFPSQKEQMQTCIWKRSYFELPSSFFSHTPPTLINNDYIFVCTASHFSQTPEYVCKRKFL